MNKWQYLTPGIPDSYFIRGKVPMTKEEVRAIVMGKLRLKEDSVLVDVGAGTGSVSIEAALMTTGGMVYGIEHNEEALKLQAENKKAFGVENFEILQGRAKEVIKTIPLYDRVFIGGSGGELKEILHEVNNRLPAGGRVVITAVTIETSARALEELKNNTFEDIEVIAVSISRGRNTGKYTLMEAQNTINIISASKGGIVNEG
ncbi:precorrin-6Y C5,15-methyltransferase (decarboxylating) subunit CbiT [Alkaliphilus hydrothermalis]|uniref:Cobalt-precorrin-6B (C15)-methyltransferase n=1 Tax=Alkaliphilus hydrothermalis TaxID=1482730 RepID=A0ABS2NP67_9FIRM|nr:precorrin-6Y C5,15-methyltransferase (decarboxylating) subunit CbiT [Alkaliphilus hydrothermalis]MBM7614725.1 cobalt-precorrin-6B (C15)-methyltransferase [Alkaliphilus hydrothermalis]